MVDQAKSLWFSGDEPVAEVLGRDSTRTTISGLNSFGPL